jgi:hypothetical protein
VRADSLARVSTFGIIGCSGGVGASTFAAVLARVAAPSLLVDLDVAAGGIDVLLDVVDRPGARWSAVRVDGGRIDPDALRDGLPDWGQCRVLAADAGPPEAEAVLQVLDAAAGNGPVVLDLARSPSPERAAALLHCDLVVLVGRADVQGVTSVHAVATALPELPRGVALRRGCIPPARAAQAAGVPLLGVLPPFRPSAAAVAPGRLPRAMVRVARGVLAGLAGLDGLGAVSGSGALAMRRTA